MKPKILKQVLSDLCYEILKKLNKKFFLEDIENNHEAIAMFYKECSATSSDNVDLWEVSKVENIAGFIVRKLNKIINCNECLNCLERSFKTNNLIGFKSYKQGCMKTPSISVFDICLAAEKEHKINTKLKRYLVCKSMYWS